MAKKSAKSAKKPAKVKIHRIKANTKTKLKTKTEPKKTEQPTILVKSKKSKTKKGIISKIFRPFKLFFNYIQESWRELKKVKWPTRKETWSLVLAVILYSLIFVAMVLLLDKLFDLLFKLMLGK